MNISLILACAGKGERAGFDKNKLLVDINGQTIFEKTLSVFLKHEKINNIIIVTNKQDKNEFIRLCENTQNKMAISSKNIHFVLGGNTRTQSVKNALEIVEDGIVLIHDGARPFLSQRLIDDCIENAIKFGGVVPIFPTRNTMVSCNDNQIEKYLGKQELFSVQTPQAFDVKKIKLAYAKAGDVVFNDDGEVYKNCFCSLPVIKGDEQNIKFTFPQDFTTTKERFTNNSPLNDLPLKNLLGENFRVGTGFDCHKLVENRKLILGGILIDHNKGLLGHSDADVVTHALMDALLSAASLRDIGFYFPDNDEQYKDANSMLLLEQVLTLIKEKNYIVKNVSICIMAEKPKLKNYIPNIIKNLANALNISEQNVGISATTLEGLGFVGREEGICTQAYVLLERIN